MMQIPLMRYPVMLERIPEDEYLPMHTGDVPTRFPSRSGCLGLVEEWG